MVVIIAYRHASGDCWNPLTKHFNGSFPQSFGCHAALQLSKDGGYQRSFRTTIYSKIFEIASVGASEATNYTMFPGTKTKKICNPTHIPPKFSLCRSFFPFLLDTRIAKKV